MMQSGALLANKLGLSDQVPASYEYLTDGRSKEFRIGALQIRLRRTAKNLMDLSGTIMGEVYMELRFLGKDQTNVEEVRSRLSQNLSASDQASARDYTQMKLMLFGEVEEFTAIVQRIRNFVEEEFSKCSQQK